MKIDFTKEGGRLTVALDGCLDTTTAPMLDSFFAENYGREGELGIDCSNLSYISSAGLRVLLSMQKKTKGAMKLTGVCELVMEVFEMTGFADILVIE